MLVAVLMLFVVGAMAALSIDVVTIYTAKSEAQLVADGAALAGARVLANSGATTDPTDLMAAATITAQSVATQVAESTPVGGRVLVASEVTVNVLNTVGGDPLVTVRVGRTDLPTFFARIWGSSQIAISATATAEAYNPSNIGGTTATTSPAVAPICVKPWLLPNVDPSAALPTATIFDPATGAITNPGLLGWSFTSPTGKAMSLSSDCPDPTGCKLGVLATPLTSWSYFPGDDTTTFPHPTHSLPSCTPPLSTNYQESVAGCIPIALACNATANVDTSPYPGNRNSDTTDAVNCLTHTTNNKGDVLPASTSPPTEPFEFVAGQDNPITGTSGSNVMVSDSLVTVPVFDSSAGLPNQNVQIIGFVQLFLNPNGDETLTLGSVNTTIVNLVGCGSEVRPGTAINGNGASPVAVRLITQ
jgi:hypothetical protein